MREVVGVVGIMCLGFAAGCGGKDSPAAPSPAPAPTLVTLAGTVSAPDRSRVPSATVRIFDGPNAGRVTQTNASGEFLFDGLAVGNANVTANAGIYDEVVMGTHINGTNRLEFVFPVPACQTNNTASVAFGNRSTSASHDVILDGGFFTTLRPGETSQPRSLSAGVAHTLRFRVSGTSRLACSDSTPVFTTCERGRVVTCSGS